MVADVYKLFKFRCEISKMKNFCNFIIFNRTTLFYALEVNRLFIYLQLTKEFRMSKVDSSRDKRDSI